jgi:hypothetical protein
MKTLIDHPPLELGEINPKRHEKFSENLYNWLNSRKQKTFIKEQKVWQDSNKELWIGWKHDGELIGTRLFSVLCNGSKAETMCYPASIKLTEVPNFWENYKKLGRCAIDPEHTVSFLSSKSRWSVTGTARICNWCGQHQQLDQRKKTVVIKTWKNTEAPAQVPAIS